MRTLVFSNLMAFKKFLKNIFHYFKMKSYVELQSICNSQRCVPTIRGETGWHRLSLPLLPFVLPPPPYAQLWPALRLCRTMGVKAESLNLCIYHHGTSVSAEILGPLVCAFTTGLHPLWSPDVPWGQTRVLCSSPLPPAPACTQLNYCSWCLLSFRPEPWTTLVAALDVWTNIFYSKMYQRKTDFLVQNVTTVL